MKKVYCELGTDDYNKLVSIANQQSRSNASLVRYVLKKHLDEFKIL